MPAFEPVTKFNATVDDVARFPDMVRQAFRVAISGTPGPVHLQFRGNEGQVDAEEAELEPLVEPQFARVPPFRPEPDDASVLAALEAAAGGRAAGDRRRRRRARLGRGRRAGRARRGAADSGRDLAQRQGRDPRQSSALGRRGRHLFARERQPGGQRRRSRLLHRHRDRRHDHAFLGGAEDRHAGDPDRHRSRGARPQLSAPGRRQRRRQGDARAHARERPTAPAPRARKAWVEEAQTICQEWARKVPTGAHLRRGADPAGAHLRASSPGTCRTTPSWWSTPATPACGWAACTISPARAQSYMRSAGHLGWAFPAGLGAKCACPDRPVVTFTGDAGLLVPHRRDRDRGALEASTPSPWSTTTAAATSRSAASTASMAASRPSRRASCGPSARSISPASPRTWARSASGSRSPARSRPRSQQALEGEPPGRHRRGHRHRRAGAAGGELRLSFRGAAKLRARNP